MNKTETIKRVETYAIDTKFPPHLKHYLPRISQIYHNLFDVDRNYDLNNLLKYRGDKTVIGLFFDDKNNLGGFAISGVQTIKANNKTYAIFSAGVYSDLTYQFGYRLAWFAFKQAIKHKLKYPTHIQGYLQEALSPAPYRWSSLNTPECYPSPQKPTPRYIDEIIKQVSHQRSYIQSTDNKYIVKFHTKRRLKCTTKLLNSKKMKTCEYFKHYMHLNPGFTQGDALLVYMPLTLKNIFLGAIKPIISLTKR